MRKIRLAIFVYLLGLFFGAIALGIWDAETSLIKAFAVLIWTILFLIVLGVLIVGTYIMMTANYEMNKMYFDTPIIKTNTSNIA